MDGYQPFLGHVGAPMGRQLGGGGGENIFTLTLYKVDNLDFWWVLVGMILFCILVDRTQALLDYLAEGSEVHTVFLQKVYTELLMFGVVAVVLFTMSMAITDLPSWLSTLLSFIDVLCSLGACSLIAVAGALSLTMGKYFRHWKTCEGTFRTKTHLHQAVEELTKEAATLNLQGIEKAATGFVSSATDLVFESLYCVSTSEEYKAIHYGFLERHKVPGGFFFREYLVSCLGRICCELMTIQWTSWMVLVSAGAFALVVNVAQGRSSQLNEDARRLAGGASGGSLSSTGSSSSSSSSSTVPFADQGHFSAYICTMALLAAGLVMANTALLLHSNRAYRSMVLSVQNGETPPPYGSRVRQLLLAGLQIILLSSCFHFGFYLMHTRYILEYEGAAWHAFFVACFLINIAVILPMVLPRITLVHGYHALDPEALERCVNQAEAIENDFHFFYRLWSQRGEPSFDRDGDQKVTVDELFSSLKELGLNLTRCRVSRLHAYLDADRNGCVDTTEIITAMQKIKRSDENTAAASLRAGASAEPSEQFATC